MTYRKVGPQFAIGIVIVLLIVAVITSLSSLIGWLSKAMGWVG